MKQLQIYTKNYKDTKQLQIYIKQLQIQPTQKTAETQNNYNYT